MSSVHVRVNLREFRSKKQHLCRVVNPKQGNDKGTRGSVGGSQIDSDQVLTKQ